jgi:maleylacetate reductase
VSAPRVHASLNALPEVLAQAGGRRVLVLSGPSQRYVETARALLAGYEIGVFAGARRHVPEDVVKEALRAFDALGASAIVAVGGGSAIGLGKALRLQRDAFFVAVPTTYAGSELPASSPTQSFTRSSSRSTCRRR